MPLDVLQPDAYSPVRDLPRIAWTPASDDLHLNLVSLKPGEEIGDHVNQTLDVVLTCLAGSGTLTADGEAVTLHPGTIAMIPQGAQRRVVAGNDGLRYTTCHRKRGGLVPTARRKTLSAPAEPSASHAPGSEHR